MSSLNKTKSHQFLGKNFMQNFKTSTKILFIVLSIVAISSALGLFVAYKTDMVESTIKANILHDSVEKAQNQGHLILTPAVDVFDKASAPEEKPSEKEPLQHQEAANYLARP